MATSPSGQQPNAAAAQAERRRLLPHGRFHGVAIPPEPEILRRLAHPIQVLGQVLPPPVVDADRLDQLEVALRGGRHPDHRRRPRQRQRVDEGALQQALVVFVAGLRIGDDAGADAERGLAGVAIDDERADGHREHRVAAGPHQADGAGVDAARLGLEGGDDLHGADLRGAGHRPAREERPHEIDDADRGRGRQLRLDRRGQLPHGRIALRREQRRHAHRPGRGQPAEIVAQQVDDHHVLGARLLALHQRVTPRAILFEPASARAGALHRPRLEPMAAPLDEQLRRRAQDDEVADVEPRAVAGLVRRAQRVDPGVEVARLDRAGALALQREGVVHLIGVAGGDERGDARDGGGEVRPASATASTARGRPRPRAPGRRRAAARAAAGGSPSRRRRPRPTPAAARARHRRGPRRPSPGRTPPPLRRRSSPPPTGRARRRGRLRRARRRRRRAASRRGRPAARPDPPSRPRASTSDANDRRS